MTQQQHPYLRPVVLTGLRAQGLMLLGVSLLLASSQVAVALYEDQAGSYDWYRPYVGHVTHAAFHKSKPRLYVSTEQGVAGALNLRDGSIAFRHLISGEDSTGSAGGTASLLLEAPSLLVTLTGPTLHAWEQTDGMQRWTASLKQAQACRHRPSMAVVAGDKPLIAVLGAGALQTFAAEDGSPQQSVELSAEAAGQSIGLVHASTADSITAYTFTPGSPAVHVTRLGSSGSTVLSSTQPLSDIAAAGPAGVAVLSHDHGSLCTAGPAATELTCTPLASLAGGAVTGSRSAQLVATASGWVLASRDPAKPGCVLLAAQEGGAPSVVATFPTASAASFPLAAAGAEHVAVVEVQPDGGLVVQYVVTSSGQVTAKEGPVQGARSESLAPDVASPFVKAAFLGSYKKRDHTEGFRLLVVWTDERISSVQQGVTVWSRDEALAGVTSVLFSDLPPTKHAAAGAANTDMSQFLHMQLLGVKVQFKVASPEEVSEYTQLKAALSDKLLPTRDARGFRRSLVVATSSGKVAALHNGDGHTLWARPGPAGRRPGQAAAPQHLLSWRVYHDLQHAPQLALMRADDNTGGTQLSVVDAYTGEEKHATALPYRIDKLVSLGAVAEEGGHAEQQVFLAVQAPAKAGGLPVVHLLPDTLLARSHFASHHRSLFFFMDQSAQGAATAPAFQGFGFGPDAAAAVSEGRPATAQLAWSLALPAPVVAWAVPDPQEPVHTSVKVLGDRSMKYRYLNPNALVLVTGTPSGVASDPQEPDDAVIYVVDTVTGAVRHHQTAPGCRAPATVLMTENLVLVQCWDATAARYVVVSMELYDASPREFSVLDHMFNPNATQPQSSFAPPPLEVLSSSFFTRTPARALLATRTRAGITSKMLLLLTYTDQVYALDMRFVDPRRPKHAKLTAEEQEERLLPYQDTLPLNPLGYTSQNKQVLGLQGAVSAASRLESTSLLFVHGIDLQYTRLAPAKGFDSLDDDFAYALLIVALVGLTAASAFMHVFTKKSMLKAKWQ